MSAGDGESFIWSISGLSDTLLLFEIADAFFSFLVSTETPLFVLKSTQTNVIDGL